MAAFLLRPFSALYGQITRIRNWLYTKEVFTVFEPTQRTISVGNITVGGTGKTPMIEFLVGKLLTGPTSQPAETDSVSLATLSRGYGRQTRGFRLAGPADSAETIGDEPLQIYRKFGQRITVAVAERRADGLRELALRRPSAQVVLLDDAFQHRAVRPHLNIMLTDYNRPFYRDHPFPAGRLREQRSGAHRADLIVVTKCPSAMTAEAQRSIVDDITPYKDTQTPVFFAGLAYAEPVSFGNQSISVRKDDPVVLVSGLANADPLEAYVGDQFQLVQHDRFNDHHAYTRKDVETIIRRMPAGAVVLTTEKDWVKLSPLLTEQERQTIPFYYLPVRVTLLTNETAFWQRVEEVAFHKNS